MTEEIDLIEKLAELEHEQWSHWMKYMFSKMQDRAVGWGRNGSTSQFIYGIDVCDDKRWKRQMNTPYSELSEKEKESDREWARKVTHKMYMSQVNSFDMNRLVTEFEKLSNNPAIDLIMVMKNKKSGSSIAYSSFPHNNTDEIADSYSRLLSLLINRSNNN